MINGLSGLMRGKIILIAILLLTSILIVPANTSANYPLGISGASGFVVPPFQSELLNDTTTYFRLYLADTAQSSLDIEVDVEGDIAQYITFPGYDGELPTFTIYPGDNLKIPYMIDFPASLPGKYPGTILAIGSPPPSQITGTGAIGKPVLSVDIIVDVPTDVQVYNFAVTNPNGFVDQDWSNWGTGWGTSFDVINGANKTFNGYCNVTLSDIDGVIEYDNYSIINLTALTGTDPHTVSWQTDLPLGETYMISAKVYSSDNVAFDEEFGSIVIPSPAKISDVYRQPDIVFGDDVVTVYAVLASSDSTVTLHWQPVGGSETTVPMTFSATLGEDGEFIGNIPAQPIDTTINYWVTSDNDAFSYRSPGAGSYSYYVFSPNIPDLVMDENSISFSPIDPTATIMNESEAGTNIIITVRNTGPGDAANILVRVYDLEVMVFEHTIPSLAGEGNSDTVNFNWAPTQGEHNLRFDVDPDNTIFELNENNNDYSISVTIHEAPPVVEDEADDPLADDLAFISIPLIILLVIFLLLFLMKKGKKINVMVYKARPSRSDKEGKMRWIYNCGYGDEIRLGNTNPTTVKATKGDIIQVEVKGLSQRDDGRIVWQSANATKLQPKLDKADDPDKIRKMIAKKKK